MRTSTLCLTLSLVCFATTLHAQEGDKRGSPLANLDSDGDGSISFAEFQTLDGERFATADANSDGSLSLDEFLSARPERGPRPKGREIDEERAAEMQARMEERAVAQFIEMDHNGDDLVSKLEMQEANFLRLDSNNDGKIAGRELRRMARGPREGAGPEGGRRPSRQRQSTGN